MIPENLNEEADGGLPPRTGSPSSLTPETDAVDINQKARSWEASYWNMREHARKLEREREELDVYLCRIKLPLPVRFVADLAKEFPGKNIRMKDVGGYLCIFSENDSSAGTAGETKLE